MENIKNSDLINHVWKECLNNKNGRALFHGQTLASKFLGPDSDWVDAFQELKSWAEITIEAFYIEGIDEKILEAQIDPFYTHPEYQKLLTRITQRDSKILELISGKAS